MFIAKLLYKKCNNISPLKIIIRNFNNGHDCTKHALWYLQTLVHTQVHEYWNVQDGDRPSRPLNSPRFCLSLCPAV